MTTPIKFSKMQGLGNDFVVIETLHQQVPLTAELIRRLSNRKTGIGFDQLLIISAAKDPQADFNYQIYNADGAEVEQCGNGARCVARFLQQEGLSQKPTINVHCLAGDLTLSLQADGHVMVNMGPPIFQPSAIPVNPQAPVDKAQLPFLDFVDQNQGHVRFQNHSFPFVTLSMGNPHCVLFLPELTTAPVAELGAALNQHPQFPAGVNVGFMQILDRQHVQLRVYERGVGETEACGSGACAAMVAGRLRNQLDAAVVVQLQGGDLKIQWDKPEHSVTMTGPATYVFRGEFTL